MATLDVLEIFSGTLSAGDSFEIYDFYDEADYPGDKDRAWFFTVVPDPHQLPASTNVSYPSSSWFQILRAWSGLWTDDSDPAHRGALSRCVEIKNVGDSEGSYHVILSISR